MSSQQKGFREITRKQAAQRSGELRGTSQENRKSSRQMSDAEFDALLMAALDMETKSDLAEELRAAEDIVVSDALQENIQALITEAGESQEAEAQVVASAHGTVTDSGRKPQNTGLASNVKEDAGRSQKKDVCIAQEECDGDHPENDKPETDAVLKKTEEAKGKKRTKITAFGKWLGSRQAGTAVAAAVVLLIGVFGIRQYILPMLRFGNSMSAQNVMDTGGVAEVSTMAAAALAEEEWSEMEAAAEYDADAAADMPVYEVSVNTMETTTAAAISANTNEVAGLTAAPDSEMMRAKAQALGGTGQENAQSTGEAVQEKVQTAEEAAPAVVMAELTKESYESAVASDHPEYPAEEYRRESFSVFTDEAGTADAVAFLCESPDKSGTYTEAEVYVRYGDIYRRFSLESAGETADEILTTAETVIRDWLEAGAAK